MTTVFERPGTHARLLKSRDTLGQNNNLVHQDPKLELPPVLDTEHGVTAGIKIDSTVRGLADIAKKSKLEKDGDAFVFGGLGKNQRHIIVGINDNDEKSVATVEIKDPSTNTHILYDGITSPNGVEFTLREEAGPVVIEGSFKGSNNDEMPQPVSNLTTRFGETLIDVLAAATRPDEQNQWNNKGPHEMLTDVDLVHALSPLVEQDSVSLRKEPRRFVKVVKGLFQAGRDKTAA